MQYMYTRVLSLPHSETYTQKTVIGLRKVEALLAIPSFLRVHQNEC